MDEVMRMRGNVHSPPPVAVSSALLRRVLSPRTPAHGLGPATGNRFAIVRSAGDGGTPLTNTSEETAAVARTRTPPFVLSTSDGCIPLFRVIFAHSRAFASFQLGSVYCRRHALPHCLS